MELDASRFFSSTLPSPYHHHSRSSDTLLLTSYKRSVLTDEELLYTLPTWRRCSAGFPCTSHRQHTTADSRAGSVPQTICLTGVKDQQIRQSFNVLVLNILLHVSAF
jgi:hypothetical protein